MKNATTSVIVIATLQEKMIPNRIAPIVKHGGRLIMIWECIGANSVGYLIKIAEILKKE